MLWGLRMHMYVTRAHVLCMHHVHDVRAGDMHTWQLRLHARCVSPRAACAQHVCALPPTPPVLHPCMRQVCDTCVQGAAHACPCQACVTAPCPTRGHAGLYHRLMQSVRGRHHPPPHPTPPPRHVRGTWGCARRRRVTGVGATLEGGCPCVWCVLPTCGAVVRHHAECAWRGVCACPDMRDEVCARALTRVARRVLGLRCWRCCSPMLRHL